MRSNLSERFSNDCRKTNTKVITATRGANSAMNQSEFLVITCNLFKGREKSRVQGAIGFAFPAHWLKNQREIFKPITKRSNRNRVISLKQAFENSSKYKWFLFAIYIGNILIQERLS